MQCRTTSGADVWLSDYIATHTDVLVEFRPTFRYSSKGTEYFGFGIRVDQRTGVVSTDPPAPGTRIDNFIVEAVILKNDGGKTPDRFPVRTVRVHLHNSVLKFWLTPRLLTVRRRTATGAEQTQFRFAARVEFDDHTVGDVTLHHGLRWTDAAFFVLPPAVADLAQAAKIGRIKIPASLPLNTETKITATLPAAWGGATAEARFTVAPPWAGNTPKAELFNIAQQTWLGPGPGHPENFPNVLFLPSGYTKADLPAFESHSVQLLHRARTDPLSKPFDVLSESINFWRVPLPSAERGVCVRAEVYIVDEIGIPMAVWVPPAKNPRDADALDVKHLLYLAGLPMPGDAVPLPAADLRTRWALTWPTAFGLATTDPWHTGRDLDPLDSVKLPDKEIARWQAIATRTFFDEVDGILPTSVGHAPSAPSTNNVDLGVHPDRGGHDLFDDFLVALEADGLTLGVPAPGTRIGLLWGADQTLHRFNNRGLVTVLFATGLGRAHANDGIMVSHLGTAATAWPVVPVPGFHAVQLPPNPIQPVLHEDVGRVFVHEFGHRFGLGDEYPADAEFTGSNEFSGSESDLNADANLTSLAAVRIADHFKSDRIKWNWERIRQAGVLFKPIVAAGAAFLATLYPGHAKAFAVKDEVRLRRRVDKAPLGLITDRGAVLAVDAIAGDTLTLRIMATSTVGTFDPTQFGEGSIVYAPVPAPAAVRSAVYPYAHMIAPSIEKEIDDGNGPQTEWPRTAKEIFKEWLDFEGLQLPVAIKFGGFFAKWSHRLDARIVGLYEGGGQFAKNTFHPAGVCKMRQSRNAFWSFCPVCRYILVDFIDPSRHGGNDEDYGAQYPAE